MTTSPEILARWKANTAALGIKLTEEDIARIDAGGALGKRIESLNGIVQRTESNNVVPDYLANNRKDASDER